MKARTIVRTIKGKETRDGAGVKLVRVLGRADVGQIDPFLMLDAFDSTDQEDYIKGFPLHPHRGIETFTYLVQGEFDHRDTLGNAGRIAGGEAQWMNSGRGILHEEMPAASPRLLGLQLWINLPKEHKMSPPTYKDITADDMPRLYENGAIVRVVAGTYKNVKGPQGDFVQPLLLDISLDPNADFSISIPDTNTLFLYVFEGSGGFGDPKTIIPERTAAILGPGDFFNASGGPKGIRFMLFSAKPLKEPIAWAGPIVMNSDEELQQAFLELETGSFIK